MNLLALINVRLEALLRPAVASYIEARTGGRKQSL
jgi:hypothetical protein